MSKALLKAADVSLEYPTKSGPVYALENINFEIYEGDFVCVLGPSGCGKSSLLKILAGFMKPTGGSVTLDDKVISGIDRNRGVVFQNDALFDWFSVRDNVNYGLRMRRDVDRTQIKEATDRILELMKLSDFADKMVYELSGGMRQRVSIARTLINDPEIILMDEPFSALDALTREQLQDFLRDLWVNSGKTIFFITHDIDEAMVLGTRIMIMSSRPGTIRKELTPDYTREISKEGNSRHHLSGDYFKLRREIYELITGE